MKSRPRYLSVANEYFMDKTNDARFLSSGRGYVRLRVCYEKCDVIKHFV